MMQRIGTCSLCGGDVMRHDGAWWGTVPPPGPACASCGAVPAADVIEMARPLHAATSTANVPWTLLYVPAVPPDWTAEELGL